MLGMGMESWTSLPSNAAFDKVAVPHLWLGLASGSGLGLRSGSAFSNFLGIAEKTGFR